MWRVGRHLAPRLREAGQGGKDERQRQDDRRLLIDGTRPVLDRLMRTPREVDPLREIVAVGLLRYRHQRSSSDPDN